VRDEPSYSIKAGFFETDILLHVPFESIEYIFEFRTHEALMDRLIQEFHKTPPIVIRGVCASIYNEAELRIRIPREPDTYALISQTAHPDFVCWKIGTCCEQVNKTKAMR
jgi:hypothetical protein